MYLPLEGILVVSVEQAVAAPQCTCRLADAGALRSLSGHRYRARWDSAGAEVPLPVLVRAPVRESSVDLREPSLRENVMTDYATQGFSLDHHPLSLVRARLEGRFTLSDIGYRTGGPARYVEVKETGGRIGFITPLTHNFCESCNRVRLTCTGTLYMCLGQEDAADLRAPLRASESDDLLLKALDEAIARKPKGHDFIIDRRHQRPSLSRHMSVTGG